MKPASVIIMDEHPIVRMSIEVLLQKNKNITITLKSGDCHEALDHIRHHPVDMVILDIDLPGMDGFTLLKRIKKLNNKIKVLFLSSKSESFYAGRAMRAGANGFVSKRKDLGDIYICRTDAARRIFILSCRYAKSYKPFNYAERESDRHAVIQPGSHGIALSGKWIIEQRNCCTTIA